MAVVVNGGKFEVLPNDLGRYRATRLWNEIIKFLHDNVEVGKKRNLIWQYEDVFTGANAVDVISIFLEKNKNNFPNEVTRCNAVKVCQTLLDQFVFVPATKSQSTIKFDTSPTALYRFVSSNGQLYGTIPKTQSKENIFLSPVKKFSETRVMKNTHFASRSPAPYSNPFSPVKTRNKERRSLDPGVLINEPPSPLLTSNKLNEKSSSFSRTRGLRRRHSFIAAQKAEENFKSTAKANNLKVMDSGFANKGNIHRSLRMSLHKLKIKNVKSDPSNMYESLVGNEETKKRHNVAYVPVYSQFNTSGIPTETVNEMAMSFMLTLTDISFLENILCVLSTDLPEVKPSTTNDNPALNPTPENVISNYPNGFHRNPTLDLMKIPWISAAVTCIGYIPDGLESLWSAQACKLKCYRAVATYHLSFLTPILPENYLPVYFSIIECLKNGKVNTALKILTLVIILLPPKRKLQLEKLISFLKIVADDFFVNVDKRLGNRECVLRDFTSPILSHLLLGSKERGLLVDFLINRSASIFNSVQIALNQNTTEQLLSLWDTRFCCAKNRNETNQRLLTARHLVALAMSIQNNTEINAKEKKQWLKKFLKTYPDLCS